MFTAFLGLGGNQGDTLRYLKQAKDLLHENNIIILKESSIYETEAWGIKDQANFLNQVIEIETQLYPFQLINKLLEIEEKLGRKRIVKWGSRIIDIDILYYEDWTVHSENLTIPHPALSNRLFVLEPLAEIAADYIHPIFGLNNQELKNNTTDQSWIIKR